MPYIPRQYDSCKVFLGQYTDAGNVYDTMDSMRVKSYDFYDDVYHNRPETFRVTLRGNSDTEIYLPSGRKMIDATARFLATDFNYQLKGGDITVVNSIVSSIFAREEIRKKLIRTKKSCLTRGDSLWHITAAAGKNAGERISIHTVHPGCYFPIEEQENSQRIVGVHLVDLVHDPRDTQNDPLRKVARRLTYRKRMGTFGPLITSQAMLFEIGGWDDRWLKPEQLKPVQKLWDETPLPAGITSLPVYHIPNNEPDGSSWGTSQIAGIEYVINGLNQSVTYEDLTLILQGLGIYVTTAAPPTDKATGKPLPYKLRPGNVIEIGQDDQFSRVSGVSSVSPYQEHMNFMDTYAMQGLGIPDIATGIVDVAVAQSGIALALKMGPIIAENQDKELAIAGKWDQLGFDLLRQWIPAFEGVDGSNIAWSTTFGDPMPVNRDAVVQEIVALWTAGLLLADEARQKLEKLGYDYSTGIADKLLAEAAAKAHVALGEAYPAELGVTAPPPPQLDLTGAGVPQVEPLQFLSDTVSSSAGTGLTA
jgi:hypothetical protein